MTDGYIVVEEDEDSGDSHDTLESSVLLHEIYGEEVFNKADDLIDDAPSLPNATQGTPLKKKRRRPGSRQLKFKRKPKGRKKSDYTYQPKAKPRAAKVNAATAIVSNSSHADSKTDVEAPTLSSADQRNLISLYYVHLGAPPPEEWNGEGGTVSKIVRALRSPPPPPPTPPEDNDAVVFLENNDIRITIGETHRSKRKKCR